MVMLLVTGLAFILPAPDYIGVYEKGIPYAQFLDEARRLEGEWKANSANAKVEEASLARARALKGPWRLLVVAEAACHDSVNTVPYLAKLVEGSPETLSMRIVSKAAGRKVLEAHRTPDGRTATPTIVILDAAGRLTGVIVERPAALLEYSKAHAASGDRRAWYTEDQGRHAIAEILEMIEK